MREELYGTRLYINLKKLHSNINHFKKIFNHTKIIAMIKANAYGFGDVVMTQKMEEFGINYFGVADFEEGVRLRNNGINSKIMVMNTSKSSIQMIINHKLEPVIYSMDILHAMIQKIDKICINQKTQPYPIHIKINTGMNRWGFNREEIPDLIAQLQLTSKQLIVKSLYSHFSSAQNERDNPFTIKQIDDFLKITSMFKEGFNYNISQHIHNSSGSMNFKKTILPFNFARIGIGLYGFLKDSNLQPIGELRCRISQVIDLKKNDTVGYNRVFVANKEMKIATVPFGYADGLQRSWGNGILKFYYKGYLLPTVGHISMDSCSIDVTDLFRHFEELDNNSLINEEIIYFGQDRPIWELSKELKTIPYEIVASLSRRIKRIYN